VPKMVAIGWLEVAPQIGEFDLVRFAAMHDVKFGRSLLPIGHNRLL
jgi:hypothetical protein